MFKLLSKMGPRQQQQPAAPCKQQLDNYPWPASIGEERQGVLGNPESGKLRFAVSRDLPYKRSFTGYQPYAGSLLIYPPAPPWAMAANGAFARSSYATPAGPQTAVSSSS